MPAVRPTNTAAGFRTIRLENESNNKYMKKVDRGSWKLTISGPLLFFVRLF